MSLREGGNSACDCWPAQADENAARAEYDQCWFRHEAAVSNFNALFLDHRDIYRPCRADLGALPGGRHAGLNSDPVTVIGRRDSRITVPRGRLAPYDINVVDCTSVAVATRLDKEIADNLRACRTRNFLPRRIAPVAATVRIEIGEAASSSACKEPARDSMDSTNGRDSPPLVPLDPYLDEMNQRLLSQDESISA